MLVYELPLNEIVFDFYDRLKIGQPWLRARWTTTSSAITSELVKLDILVTGEPVDALSLILHSDKPRPAAERSPSRSRS